MRMLSKAMRYRALAARETNKAIIGLLNRLADEVERKQSRARPVGVSAEIILFPQRPASINQGLMGIHVWPESKRAS